MNKRGPIHAGVDNLRYHAAAVLRPTHRPQRFLAVSQGDLCREKVTHGVRKTRCVLPFLPENRRESCTGRHICRVPKRLQSIRARNLGSAQAVSYLCKRWPCSKTTLASLFNHPSSRFASDIFLSAFPFYVNGHERTTSDIVL